MLTQYTVQRSAIIDHNEYSGDIHNPRYAEDMFRSTTCSHQKRGTTTLTFSIDGVEYMSASGQDYHWEFVCDTAGSYSDTSWEAGSLNDGSIPGELGERRIC